MRASEERQAKRERKFGGCVCKQIREGVLVQMIGSLSFINYCLQMYKYILYPHLKSRLCTSLQQEKGYGEDDSVY